MSSFSELSGCNILVTGANGFIGTALIKRLCECGAEVYALVRSGGEHSTVIAGESRVVTVFSDFESGFEKTLAMKLPKIDLLYHCAASGVNTNRLDDKSLVLTNLALTKAFLELGLRKEVKRFVTLGSGFEYGFGENRKESSCLNPRSFYAASKSACSLLAQAYAFQEDLPTVVIRPFVVYGPGEAESRLTTSVVKAVHSAKPVQLTQGRQVIDMLFVADLIEALVLSAVREKAVGEILNICSGKGVTVQEVVQVILKVLGTTNQVQFGALPDRTSGADKLTGDWSKAQSILGWHPEACLTDGIQATIDSIRATM